MREARARQRHVRCRGAAPCRPRCRLAPPSCLGPVVRHSKGLRHSMPGGAERGTKKWSSPEADGLQKTQSLSACVMRQQIHAIPENHTTNT
eukprot:359267-Chlamydomonas_euryale.AAC.4